MRQYRVAVIGSTNRGNYGHGLDTVWKDVANTKLVAVADDNPKGLSKAQEKLKVPGFADYRKLLDDAKPEIVSIAPRWLDQHREMVLAAAARGAHIYLEKPMCRTLQEADEMVAACEKNKVKLAIAFQTRYSPIVRVMRDLIEDGEIGNVLEYRARGKEDRRGGGEDLWVLGTHMFNLISHFAGDPSWCFASVRQNGETINKSHVKSGTEGIGPLAGDSVQAMYRMSDGTTAYFNSNLDSGGRPTRFGLTIYGSKGIIELVNTGMLPIVHILKDSAWSPGQTGSKWVRISSQGVGRPEVLKDGGLHGGNVLVVKDLIDAIEQDRQPEASIYEARNATEMVVACFESQRLDRPVSIPLKTRTNPLEMLSGPKR